MSNFDFNTNSNPFNFQLPIQQSPIVSGNAHGNVVNSKVANTVENLMSITTGLSFFYDNYGTCYTQINIQGTLHFVDLNSRKFKDCIFHTYYEKYKKFINQNDLKAMLSTIRFNAMSKGKQVNTYNRIAFENDNIYIDMKDGKENLIHVTKSGWNIIPNPGFIYKRYQNQEALPIPDHGGNPRELFKLFPLEREEDRVLVLSWMIASYFIHMPSAYLWICGAEGSGKTLMATFIKSIIDPCIGRGLSLSNNNLEVAQVMDHNFMPFFDNVSYISKNISDLFCLAYSNGKVSKRELYSNGDDYIYNPTRIALFTVRDFPKIGSDLLDRSIIICLNRIDKLERRVERKLMEEFNEMRSRVLGGILDALVKTLNMYSLVQLNEYCRIADFQAIGVAAAEALGFDRTLFLNALKQNEVSQIDIMIDTDILLSTMKNFMQSKQGWDGYPNDLLSHLKAISQNPNQLPKDPAWLGRRLRVIAPSLEKAGIKIVFPKHNDGKGMKYTIINSAPGDYSSLQNQNSNNILNPPYPLNQNMFSSMSLPFDDNSNDNNDEPDFLRSRKSAGNWQPSFGIGNIATYE